MYITRTPWIICWGNPCQGLMHAKAHPTAQSVGPRGNTLRNQVQMKYLGVQTPLLVKLNIRSLCTVRVRLCISGIDSVQPFRYQSMLVYSDYEMSMTRFVTCVYDLKRSNRRHCLMGSINSIEETSLPSDLPCKSSWGE